eukprot:gene3559-5524_t
MGSRLAPLAHLVTPPAADLPVLLLSPAQFARLPRLCGAIWHGSTLSREIRREVVNELREGLGQEAFALALAHRQLGGAADLLREPAELIDAIDRDGLTCVAAWLQAQPAELQGWLPLRFVAPKGYSGRLPRDLEIVQTVAARRPAARILRADEAALWTDGFAFVQAARAHAEQIKADSDQWLHTARAEGFESARREGAEQVAQLMLETQAEVQHYLAGLEASLADLALGIVREVLGELDDTDRVVRCTRQALSAFRQGQALTLWVPPAEVNALRPQPMRNWAPARPA